MSLFLMPFASNITKENETIQNLWNSAGTEEGQNVSNIWKKYIFLLILGPYKIVFAGQTPYSSNVTSTEIFDSRNLAHRSKNKWNGPQTESGVNLDNFWFLQRRQSHT